MPKVAGVGTPLVAVDTPAKRDLSVEMQLLAGHMDDNVPAATSTPVTLDSSQICI